MTDNTPRFDLGTYAQGDEDWSHTDTVETLDELAVDRGPIDDRPASGDYDDEFYYATDQRVLWRWDSGTSDWNAAAGLGSDSQRVPGTTYLDDLDATTLADTALDSEIDTAQLSDDAVTAAKIAAAAVDSGAIASGAVSVDELADALGTTSSSKVPGTTYFEESSHEALEAENIDIAGQPLYRDIQSFVDSETGEEISTTSTTTTTVGSTTGIVPGPSDLQFNDMEPHSKLRAGLKSGNGAEVEAQLEILYIGEFSTGVNASLLNTTETETELKETDFIKWEGDGDFDIRESPFAYRLRLKTSDSDSPATAVVPTVETALIKD